MKSRSWTRWTGAAAPVVKVEFEKTALKLEMIVPEETECLVAEAVVPAQREIGLGVLASGEPVGRTVGPRFSGH